MDPNQRDHSQRTYSIHLSDDPIIYGVTEDDLDKINNSKEISAKNYCIAFSSLSIPFLVNAVAEIYNGWGTVPFPLTAITFLNSVAGGVTFFFSVGYGIAWFNSRGRFDLVVKAIKQRPRHNMEISHKIHEEEKYLEGEITGEETADTSPDILKRGVPEKIDGSK